MKIRSVNNKATQFMLFLVVTYFGFNLVLGAIIGAVSMFGDIPFENMITSPLVLMMTQVGGLLVPLFIWLNITDDKFKASMPKHKLGTTNIVIVIALGFLAQPAMMVISYITSLFFPNVADELITAMAAQPLLLMLVAVAVTPGIVEEVVFRGYVQSRTPGTTVLKMALLNGLLFGMIHMNFQQFSYAFVMGVLLAYLVYYTKSIWAGIIPHFIMNATQVTLGRFAQEAEATLATYYNGMPEISEAVSVVILVVVAVIASVICAVLIRALISHNKERFENEPQETTDILKLFAIETGERKVITIDWCFWASVVLFLLAAIFLM